MSAIPGTQVDFEIEINALRERVAQLQTELDSRVAIEQAKGILMERFALTPDAAFELLRRAARNSRNALHTLAALVPAARTTPPEIIGLLTETERGRNRHTSHGGHERTPRPGEAATVTKHFDSRPSPTPIARR